MRSLVFSKRMSRFVTLLLLLLAVTSLPVALSEVVESDGVVKVMVRYNTVSDAFSVDANATFGAVAATVTVNTTFLTTGWDVVEAVADVSFLSATTGAEAVARQQRLAHRAMGFGEGYATQQRLQESMNNTFEGKGGLTDLIDASPNAQRWVEEHIQYMESVREANDTFGQQLLNLLALLDGIVDGYNARVGTAGATITKKQLFYLNFQAEFGDVVRAVSSEARIATLEEAMPNFFVDLHCSALVKVVPNDIYFSHVTWNSFNSMLRQYKTYRIGSRFVTMSSYPGVIHSIDDWYMTYNRLAVMETTNGVYNTSLFRNYLKPNTVSEFLRVMIANFIAVDSPSWVKLFAQENSGTYNNQFMVFNMGAVKDPNKPFPANTFWVAEQLPGEAYPIGVTSADMTEFINNNGYWPSYNIPYFDNVYNVSGYLEKYNTLGDFFSYTKYARPLIFKRDHHKVVNLTTMKRMMRYDDFKHDPYSLITNCEGAGDNNTCDPPYSSFLSIASRGDLNPSGNASDYGPLYPSLGHRNHGATDAKIAVWSGMINGDNTYTAHVINGPTNDQQPTFVWTNDLYDPMPPIYGLPKTYNFSFVAYTTAAPSGGPTPDNSNDERNKWIGIGIGAGVALLVVVAIAVLILRSRRNAKYMDDESAVLVQ